MPVVVQKHNHQSVIIIFILTSKMTLVMHFIQWIFIPKIVKAVKEIK